MGIVPEPTNPRAQKEHKMIHIYHGNGKGKTTAAMGLALRAIADGQRVLIVQFLKGSESGEITLLGKYDQVTIYRGKPNCKFSFQMNEQEKCECLQSNEDMLCRALEEHARDPFGTIFLDEVNGALSTELLCADLLKNVVREASGSEDGLELICTGRNPQDWLVDAADYITEMKCERHPFNQGVCARKGVEE